MDVIEQAYGLPGGSDIGRTSSTRPGSTPHASAGVNYRLRAYVAGGLQLTVDWVNAGARVPLDELVDILVEMVPEPFRPYFV